MEYKPFPETTKSVPLNICFGKIFHMIEDAIVDGVDDGVGPEAPIHAGPHFILIGGGAFEARATVRQAD